MVPVQDTAALYRYREERCDVNFFNQYIFRKPKLCFDYFAFSKKTPSAFTPQSNRRFDLRFLLSAVPLAQVKSTAALYRYREERCDGNFFDLY